MRISNAETTSVHRDQVLGRLGPDTTCRSAIILKNRLIAVQIYLGNLPSYDSSTIALFNSKSNRLIKKLKVSMNQAPSNLQQHTLLTNPSENMLIVCDDYGIYIYSLENALKLHSKYSTLSHLVESPLPYLRLNQPLTRVRVFNNEELLIAKGSSLMKWNFYENRSAIFLSDLLTYTVDKKIADIEYDNERQLLFVMLELLFTYEYCEIIIYDLADGVDVLSSVRLDCLILNRFWGVNIESGSISVIQSDLVQKKSVVTFLTLGPDFQLTKRKNYEVEGWTLRHLNASQQLSCVVISLMVGDAFKRVWGYFYHAEDRFFQANFSIKEGTTASNFPRSQKVFEYFDKIGCFIGFDSGTIFLTKLNRVIKRQNPVSSKKFWKYVSKN